jgi:ketosteroid isomerase-like protein
MAGSGMDNVTRGFAEAFNRGDLEAAAEFYSDDATFLHPNADIVSGKQAIKEFFEAGRAFLGLKKLHFDILDSDYDGTLAYERGVIQMEMAPEGGPALMDKGKYVVVMKGQPDGSWKVVIDIWNSDLQQPVPK